MTESIFSLSTYHFDLPDGRIAQKAVHPPESAKMLIFDRMTRRCQD